MSEYRTDLGYEVLMEILLKEKPLTCTALAVAIHNHEELSEKEKIFVAIKAMQAIMDVNDE